MHKSNLKIIVTIGILLAPFLAIHHVYCQGNIESATREVDRMGEEAKGRAKKLERTPSRKPAEIKIEEVPAQKGEKAFLVKKINLTGVESFSTQEFASLVSKYENKEVTLTDLNILAKDIEQAYLEKGVIAAVFVPPQEIKEGTVTLQVVEAKLGALQIQEQPFFNKQRLKYYWRTRPGETLHYDKISKDLKMMNKNPDREVKSALTAGEKPGTTDVVLAAKTQFPLHMLSSFDKEGVTSSGKSRLGFGARHNNFLGLDDMLLTGYTYGADFSGFYAYHNIPVSPFGTSLVYGYSQSVSTPKKEFTPFGIRSEAKNSSVSLYQDLYRKDNYLGDTYLTFDAKDKTIEMNTGTYNRDRLRVFRVGGDLSRRDLSSTASLSLEASQGVKALGASSESNPFASRGAKASFNKFITGIQYKRNLPWGLQASMKTRYQFSHQKLTPQEELGMGGINSVRGYPADDYLGDNAVLTNAEFLIPAFFIPQGWRIPYAPDSVRDQTTLVAFADYGYGSRIQPAASEKKSKNLLGVGAGVRFNVFNQALLRLEWGFPLAGNHPITESGRSRFHFSVDFQDRLPEEIERISKEMEEDTIKRTAWQLVNDELAKENSPVRQKIEGALVQAREYNGQGKLSEARDAYAKVLELSNALYQQSQDYVREFFKKEDELKDYRKQAIKLSRLGQLEDSKKEWGKVIEEGSQAQPLSFSFQ